MGTIFMIMLAEAMLATTTTGPRTRATTTPTGPQGPTHPPPTSTSPREGARDFYKPVCSSHAAHDNNNKDWRMHPRVLSGGREAGGLREWGKEWGSLCCGYRALRRKRCPIWQMGPYTVSLT